MSSHASQAICECFFFISFAYFFSVRMTQKSFLADVRYRILTYCEKNNIRRTDETFVFKFLRRFSKIMFFFIFVQNVELELS